MKRREEGGGLGESQRVRGRKRERGREKEREREGEGGEGEGEGEGGEAQIARLAVLGPEMPVGAITSSEDMAVTSHVCRG
eukprot:1305704-Rhodomonas_salina.2